MKNIHIKLIATILLVSVLLCGCGASANVKSIAGEWGYIHEPEKAALIIKDNGKTILDDVAYTADADDTYITLKASDGTEEKLRYVLDKDGMLLYKNTVYQFDGDNPSSLVGTWKHDKWSFEFTEDGTFYEDGYFPGYYVVDESNNTIKLVYNDHFEDAVIYYEIEGNELRLEYPWRMVKIK